MSNGLRKRIKRFFRSGHRGNGKLIKRPPGECQTSQRPDFDTASSTSGRGPEQVAQVRGTSRSNKSKIGDAPASASIEHPACEKGNEQELQIESCTQVPFRFPRYDGGTEKTQSRGSTPSVDLASSRVPGLSQASSKTEDSDGVEGSRWDFENVETSHIQGSRNVGAGDSCSRASSYYDSYEDPREYRQEERETVDYTVHERSPAVIEHIRPQKHIVYEPRRTRSIHFHEHFFHVQPVLETPNRRLSSSMG